MHDERTSKFGFKKPHLENDLEDDVVRLREALDGIDKEFFTEKTAIQKIEKTAVFSINEAIKNIITLTRTEYDALETKDTSTLYLVTSLSGGYSLFLGALPYLPDDLLAALLAANAPSAKNPIITKSDLDVLKPVNDSGLVPGTFIWYCGSTPPNGYLECNGAIINRATYSELFAAIGTVYGTGNGSTTFSLPDLRDEFIRGNKAGKSVGTKQAMMSGVGISMVGATLPNSAASTLCIAVMNTVGSPYSVSGLNYVGVPSLDMYPNQNVAIYSTSRSFGISLGSNSRVTNDYETRPRNIALLPCIKY